MNEREREEGINDKDGEFLIDPMLHPATMVEVT
jgi:hypothetical protein